MEQKTDKIKFNTILKFFILGFILYKIYNIPQSDWDAGHPVTEESSDGTRTRYIPNNCSYLQYVKAWWSYNLSSRGLTSILDEYLLGPLGLVNS